jgi:hypothetical protein
MPIDLAKIKQRYESFQNNDKRSSKTKEFVWKPTPGKQVVRIVPNQYQPDNPFVELKFHYGLNGKTYLSPASFNRPDPVVELSDRLKKSGDKDQWKLGRGMEPKMRTYVPVIVRGEEEKGVKFWGFGQTVYKQLLSIMSEPDYGDITDLAQGFDVQVEFKTAEETGKSYPDTSILIKPRPRPVIDPQAPNAKAVLELITQKQPNILDVYTESSYEDLAVALEEYLKASQEGTETSVDTQSNDKVVSSADPVETVINTVTEDVDDASTAFAALQASVNNKATPPAPVTPLAPTPSPSATQAKSNATVAELSKVFDDIFTNTTK